MILLERIKKKLTMAVKLKDELAPEKKVIGDVFIKASGIRKPIVKHSTGYFLFIDFLKGKYTLTAGGKFYRQDDFPVDTAAIDPKQPFIELSLNPKSNYPFPDGISVLKGRIVDSENKPLPQASIKIKDMTESAVSEDDGGFFIQFKALEGDKNITITISKDKYNPAGVTVLLKKGATTRTDTIQLIMK